MTLNEFFFASIQSDSLPLDDFDTARLFMNHNRPRRRVPRAQSRRSGDAETKAHCPGSSTCDALTRDQEKPSPVHPQNAGAPSSKPSAEDKAAEPAGREEGEEQAADSQPLEMLTH
ncbi:uncharacterized protein mbpa isoform X5 [Pungitius pungitius]|uniref:uncharacterized protein mbpa isoform X5 n=1 Tax=Pungitius pungitius TaxID=134920 RepID=UPI002E0F7F7C